MSKWFFFLAAYGLTYFAHNDHNIPVSGYHLLYLGVPICVCLTSLPPLQIFFVTLVSCSNVFFLCKGKR